MKRILSITGILTIAILFTSAISIREMPQDPPRGKKAQKHIKMIKVGDDGKKVEIDTIIEGDNIFIFEGDTMGGAKTMKWVSDEDFDFDMDFDIDVEQDGNAKVIIMKSGKDGKHVIREFKFDGDCEDTDLVKWHGKSGDEKFFGDHSANTPKIIRIEKKGGNVIDLSDHGIISYKKKELKGGKEKITIIREKPSKEEMEIHEEIIMHNSGDHSMFLHEGHGAKSKQIKVIAGDDGKVEIIEDGKVLHIDESDEDVQIIEKDGKKIIIKKQKKGGEIKVNVEVEEENSEGNEHK